MELILKQTKKITKKTPNKKTPTKTKHWVGSKNILKAGFRRKLVCLYWCGGLSCSTRRCESVEENLKWKQETLPKV